MNIHPRLEELFRHDNRPPPAGYLELPSISLGELLRRINEGDFSDCVVTRVHSPAHLSDAALDALADTLIDAHLEQVEKC